MAVQCRLAVTQIRALEEERLENLPEPVYVRAFIRGYAHALKIDPAPLVDDYMMRWGAAAQPWRWGSSRTVLPLGKRFSMNRRKPHLEGRALRGVGGACWRRHLGSLYRSVCQSAHPSEAQKVESGANEAKETKTPAAEPAESAAAPSDAALETQPAQPSARRPGAREARGGSPLRRLLPSSAAPAQLATAASAQPPAAAPVLHKVEFRLGAGASWVQVIAPNGRNVVASEMRPQSVQAYEIPKGSRFTIGNAGVVSPNRSTVRFIRWTASYETASPAFTIE